MLSEQNQHKPSIYFTMESQSQALIAFVAANNRLPRQTENASLYRLVSVRSQRVRDRLFAACAASPETQAMLGQHWTNRSRGTLENMANVLCDYVGQNGRLPLQRDSARLYSWLKRARTEEQRAELLERCQHSPRTCAMLERVWSSVELTR